MQNIRRAAVVAGVAATFMMSYMASAEASTPSWQITGVSNASASGNFTWYNRSVGVSGTISQANLNESIGLTIQFYVGSAVVDTRTQTLSATSYSTSFSFTEDGSAYVGGITEVKISLTECGVSGYGSPSYGYR